MEIKTIKSRDSHPEVDEKIIYESEVRQLEADFKEAIEMLKNDAISTDDFLSDHSNIPFRQDHIEAHKNRIKIVEKAYSEKWKNIRREK